VNKTFSTPVKNTFGLTAVGFSARLVKQLFSAVLCVQLCLNFTLAFCKRNTLQRATGGMKLMY
jgi:hypothetical protein